MRSSPSQFPTSESKARCLALSVGISCIWSLTLESTVRRTLLQIATLLGKNLTHDTRSLNAGQFRVEYAQAESEVLVINAKAAQNRRVEIAQVTSVSSNMPRTLSSLITAAYA